MSRQAIAHVTLVVRDYDEAIRYYIDKLGFCVIEDSPLAENKRWVLIAPPGNAGACLLLAKAANENQQQAIGNQAGGRVGFFLFTDDFDGDYNRMISKGVSFIRPPMDEDYGTVAVFEDCYGNRWDLIQPTSSHSLYHRFNK